jgi:hypothetical protein
LYEEEDDDETRNQFAALQCHPCIADLQCLCPLSLCLQLQVGGRAFVAEHKQNKGSLSLLSRARPRDKGSVCAPCDAKQGPFLLLRGSINKNNPLTSTFLLMSSRSTAQVIFTCPPPPAGSRSPETSLHCPGFVGSVTGLLPLISCKPTKLLLQRNAPCR